MMTPILVLTFSSLSSLITMSIQRNHLLMALLALETLMLSLTLLIPLSMFKNSSNDISTILIILTFAACEASVGLACLVKLVRSKGNDLIKLLNSTKC
uniref:NADH dehydrogenase subunit 4L n=1 Tax=Diopatra cuprea TaxID=398472 RepID=UPI001D126B42|nr:NADH dehydrogenase subunit 4L [Diopatra cuprea]QZM06615.1 NADH dehydrogenase subunit 4L [Diopatra cuprea]